MSKEKKKIKEEAVQNDFFFFLCGLISKIVALWAYMLGTLMT